MWNPFRKKVETRSSWSDAVARLEHILKSDQGIEDVTQTLGSGIASGLAERAFMSSTVSSSKPMIQDALKRSTLAYMARQVTRQGESLHLIKINGSVELWPSHNWEIYGDTPSEKEWTYDVYCPSPQGQFSARVPSSDVIHVRIQVDRDNPWDGKSALRCTPNVGSAVVRSERSISQELSGPVGRLIPAPMSPENTDESKALMSVIKSLNGSLMMVESMVSGHGNLLRSDSMQKTDWMQKRIGPEPTQYGIELLSNLIQLSGMSYGIPAEMLRADASSSARREAWRQYFHSVLEPLMKLIQEELRIKLDDPSLKLSLRSLGASDIQGRARSFASLVKAGMNQDEAKRLAGLE